MSIKLDIRELSRSDPALVFGSLVVIALCVLAFARKRRYNAFKRLQGPADASWLLGEFLGPRNCKASRARRIPC